MALMFEHTNGHFCVLLTPAIGDDISIARISLMPTIYGREAQRAMPADMPASAALHARRLESGPTRQGRQHAAGVDNTPRRFRHARPISTGMASAYQCRHVRRHQAGWPAQLARMLS